MGRRTRRRRGLGQALRKDGLSPERKSPLADCSGRLRRRSLQQTGRRGHSQLSPWRRNEGVGQDPLGKAGLTKSRADRLSFLDKGGPGDDVPGRAHTLPQPTHDRATAGADLQTAPTFTYPDRVRVAERVTIALRLDQLQASKLIARLGISCKVARHRVILARSRYRISTVCAAKPVHPTRYRRRLKGCAWWTSTTVRTRTTTDGHWITRFSRGAPLMGEVTRSELAAMTNQELLAHEREHRGDRHMTLARRKGCSGWPLQFWHVGAA